MRRIESVPARVREEQGIALLTSILVLMLTSALAIGFVTVVSSDQRYRGIDRDRVSALYAAHSGIEKLTADLGSLFLSNVAPTADDIGALGEAPPEIDGVTFAPDSAAGYGIAALGGASNGQISTGPYEGLMALKTTYELTSVARTSRGGEVHLKRRLESVAIPVFQFGMFSDVDLSFSAADMFDFGGRVHTNRNLFLAQGPTGTPSAHCNSSTGEQTLWLKDKVTAVGEIVRQQLSNGNPISESSTRRVCASTAPGAFRSLLPTEGSVVAGPTSAKNTAWPTISLSTYNGNIRNGTTGARPLNLALVTTGGTNTDLVGRPVEDEDVDQPQLFGERLFGKVSLRILLSDTADDITALPTVTDTPPVLLDGNWNDTPPDNGTGVLYGPVSATRPPIARSPGSPATATTTGSTSAGSSQINVVGTLPDFLRPPVLTIHHTTPVTNVRCARRSNTQLQGCTGVTGFAGTIPVGTRVTATVDSVEIETWTTASVSPSAGSISISVQSGTPALFVAPPFWVNNMLVQCAEHNDAANRLENCSGVTSSIAAGSTITTAALSDQTTDAVQTSPIGGYIKIEIQDDAGAWTDVTMEILGHGIAGPSLGYGTPVNCTDPNPNAIIRLQRLRDNPGSGTGSGADLATCNNTASLRGIDYWPNVLFDAREAILRDAVPTGGQPRLGGVVHFVELDVRNLTRWLSGVAPYDTGSGPDARWVNGYAVYFSDRRNNRNAANQETGEYGWEDVVNPENADGAPNGVLDVGEDINGNGALDTYGQFPTYGGVHNTVPPGAAAPLNLSAHPTTEIGAAHARVNRAVLFRRALKLTNGGITSAGVNNISVDGLTIVAENPVYVQGDWNARSTCFAACTAHVPTAVIADTVVVLSSHWNDNRSLTSPYAVAGRPRNSNTYYRMAIISGKSRIFPRPNGTGATFGTDGGAHSFLRMLEGATGTVHYRGSMTTFYYSRQAVSPFKCCGGVIYSIPTRAFAFDIDFLDPAKLPPLTPVFRDLNALGFTQEIRPGR